MDFKTKPHHNWKTAQTHFAFSQNIAPVLILFCMQISLLILSNFTYFDQGRASCFTYSKWEKTESLATPRLSPTYAICLSFCTKPPWSIQECMQQTWSLFFHFHAPVVSNPIINLLACIVYRYTVPIKG